MLWLVAEKQITVTSIVDLTVAKYGIEVLPQKPSQN